MVMAIGSHFAVVCGAAVAQDPHRAALFAMLRATGHDIVDISPLQMLKFAGNVLELASPGGPLIAVSSTALRSLDAAQRRALESHAGLVPVDIPTVERCGGGGVRCMLAELHLPKHRQGATAMPGPPLMA